ncbi:ATP-dependent helicase [Angustibacter sp. McL0619]|uniref:ATP-dependent helicase n=1 Tax=Angustibacter sp. McL0619 TaxID=3415676 RepID=UPI003CE7D1BA
MGVPDVLQRFSPATREWFRAAFAEPTAAQVGAWDAISTGQHALVVAPTGSGKTLSAFLWALDRLASEAAPAEPLRRCRVIYVSPLKALAVDVERNLRAPLTGIGHAAARLGQPVPQVSVGVRSGDTPAKERRTFARTPTDVLITTPESLFLLLTSQAREALAGVTTVILDEVHAVAGTKRGAHLALSLERLDALLPEPAQRIGLSATVRPVDEVARYLAGGRPVTVVQPPSDKVLDLRVVVPVPDLGAIGEPTGDLDGPAAGDPARTSIWPHVEERVVDLVADHSSTLVFANSRRLAERLTARLNEVWQERLDAADLAGPVDRPEPDADRPAPRTPAQLMAQAGSSAGAPPVLARAHHGSVSKEQRALIEEELKAGRLPAVVATSSLELGIDMGAIDLVVQVESPPSVASGLQRVGRAGHQVGAVSRGVLFPKFRGDLVQTAVVVERMRSGDIEALRLPANPLDVLAQQVVAMCAMDDWAVDDLAALVGRAAPFATLTRGVLDAVLDMLAGRYPSEEFAELRPRLVWDRHTDQLTGRPGAQRLAVTSGGTIPDRGLFGVFLATGEGPGRRVGELDEEMVYESRVSDVFTLGSSSWRIEDITHDRVLVTPAPGQPGKLPFWHGDTLGRPAELGRAVGAFVREVGALDADAARERVRRAGLDEWATDNLLEYLAEQREASGHLPDDRTIVVERFRDELGDWRVVVHSPFGAQVHAPWALAVSARMQERFGVDVQAMHGDDGLVLRLPDVELDDGPPVDVAALVTFDPDDVHDVVTEQIGGSALFASRFRECAGRALLLPRRRPGQRQPLWQQRQRSAQLLQVASGYPDFPIVLETVRECVQDVFDVPGLADLMREIASRKIQVVEIESSQPSPFARSLMFGYVAQFLYEGDSPLAERRAAALALDPTLLSELLGRGEGAALRDLLDPAAVERTELELQHLTPERAARHAEDVADLLRVLGPLSTAEVAARAKPADEPTVAGWLASLEAARRLIRVRIAGEPRWSVVEDAGRLRDALGVPLPVGIPEAFMAPVADPLGELVSRYARTHGPFTVAEVAERFGLGAAVAATATTRLVRSGRLVEGELRPSGQGLELCDAEVLRSLRRRSLAALRQQVEPVPARDLARFLPQWQGLAGRHGRGAAGLLRAVEQLDGAVLPASAVETLVLPHRVTGYTPGLLDEFTSSGEVLWCGRGALPGDDGWVSLHLADSAPLTLPEPAELELTPTHQAVLDALSSGGAFFFRALSDAVAATDDTDLADSLWDLVWSGRITGDTLAPLRARLSGGRTAHRPGRTGPRRSRYAAPSNAAFGSGRVSGVRRPAMPSRSGPPTAAGRWSVLPTVETEPTARAAALAETLLDRHGVLTRGAVTAEGAPGGFAAVYRVLSAFEDAGRVRRGYYVEGLGAAQFATTGPVDRLRALEDGPATTLVVAAADPANPYGAALPWPDRGQGGAELGSVQRATQHKPGRKAGALVVLNDGALVLYVERGGRTLLSFTDDEQQLSAAADALALAVREGALGRLTVERADGAGLLGSGHPMVAALEAAGFHATPRGLRLRR